MLGRVTDADPLLTAIAALEAQRALLGDSAVDASVDALRARIAAAASAAPQSLRQVTILFLDIVGSTTLSQRLDPEEIHAVLDGALARCTEIVGTHRGKVLQYAGDNLLAVFGAEQSREDDAERAVHCGLALLHEGARLGAEVPSQASCSLLWRSASLLAWIGCLASCWGEVLADERPNPSRRVGIARCDGWCLGTGDDCASGAALFRCRCEDRS